MDEHPVLWKVRTRWAAVGAAVAVVAGAGGIAVSGATNSQLTPSETVITPCRIMDTRPEYLVGTRNVPLTTDFTHTIQVTGKNGNCNLPADVVSVTMNVTAVNPGLPGHITVFPAGPSRPATSTLNYVAGQGPIANLVKSGLSDDGRVSFYARFGPVDLIADITSYTTGARLSTADLAQNRWDRDRARPLTVNASSTRAEALLYDGTNVWVANKFANSVSRFNATTGTKLADINVGTYPVALAYDGTNIWVANQSSSSVSRINATTGTKLPDVVVGSFPTALAFDGTNIWVANQGSNSVSRINAATGTKVPLDLTVGAGPTALAYDGTNIWVANQGDATVTRIILGAILRISTVGVGSFPVALAYDGTNVWVANSGSNSLSRINAATGTKLPTDLTGIADPGAMAFDGTSMWVVSQTSGSVIRFNATTAVSSLSLTVGSLTGALAYDGSSMWLTDLVDGKVRRLRPEG